MSRFYIRPDSIKDGKVFLKGEELHHVRDVMRLDVGDVIVAFDGEGKEYLGKIAGSSAKELVIGINKVISSAKSQDVQISLACGIPKLDRMDYIVQKSTELGVKNIYPLITKRTIVSLPDEKKAQSRKARWERIAVESSKQCGRVVLPEVKPITGFSQFMQSLKGFDVALIATLVEGAKDLKDILKNSRVRNVVLLIGPEGDFTKEEVEAAVKKGCMPVFLGPLVLRCDTAAIYALSVLNYELLYKQ